MIPVVSILVLALVAGPASLTAEQPPENSSSLSVNTSFSEGSAVALSRTSHPGAALHPFTFGASMGSVSSLGAQFQIATNLNRHMNLRTNFNVFEWKKRITYGGYTSLAHMNMVSSNTSLDFYPFPNHGLRFSPGIIFHNREAALALIDPAPNGGQFTVNDNTYYSSTSQPNSADPRQNTGPEPVWVTEGLELRHTAFTMTTGWGNMIPRKKTGGFSFPVELGVALLGSPSVKTTFIGGMLCDSHGQNCFSAASDQRLKSDLQSQFAPYKSHLDLLKTYPIISFGVAYSFGIRPVH